MSDRLSWQKCLGIVLVGLSILLDGGGASASEDGRRPNIVLIVSDDMGYSDLGVTGCQDIPTPHLDALARSGTRFSNAYVTAAYCAPSRAGLLTGIQGNRFGFEFNAGRPTSAAPIGLDPAIDTLAEKLRELGYHNAAVGKWHLGKEGGMHPLDQGFDEYFGILGGGSRYFGSAERPLQVTRDRKTVVETEYLTDAFGREATAFIERATAPTRQTTPPLDGRPAPFFLYLAFNAVHDPMQAKPEDLARAPSAEGTLRKPYAGMLIAMDDAVGRVLEQLRRSGVEDQTLVVFVNDNGGPTAPINSNVNGSRNHPLRGGKRQLSEGGIRVPFFVRWPGVSVADSVIDDPVTTLDLFVTFLLAAGCDRDRLSVHEGLDLAPRMRGEQQHLPERSLCWRFGYQFAIRRGDWKLVRWKHDDGSDFTSGLFRLSVDPGESSDLRDQHPEIVSQLRREWERWNERNIPPLWGTAEELREANRLSSSN